MRKRYSQYDTSQPDKAFQKWFGLSDAERSALKPSFDRLSEIKNLGEKGAVELLYALGKWMNKA